jgi:hypothetical protein
MAGKNTSVMALFQDSVQLGYATERLREAGFRGTDISVLMADNIGNKDLGHVKDTKAPEGTTTGAATGAVIGGTLGWLAGIGMLAIPGVGPLIAAGPIMAALAGAGIGGSVGGITGALVGMGIPEYEAKRYEGMIKEGKALISVHCDSQDWVSKAKKILEDCGGKDVASRSEAGAELKGTETDRPYAKTQIPPLRTDLNEIRPS